MWVKRTTFTNCKTHPYSRAEDIVWDKSHYLIDVEKGENNN